jgi:hypothetical protein
MTITVQESIARQVSRYGVTQQAALEAIIYDASLFGHKFYSGDGHPIPQSSYRPYKGAPVDTQS